MEYGEKKIEQGRRYTLDQGAGSLVGVPLTSQEHVGSWYVPFVFKDKKQYAALHQTRSFSVNRLHKRMGQIPESDFELVITGLKKLYFE